MDFFVISQDERISVAVKPINVSKVISQEMLDINKAKKMGRLFLQLQIKDKEYNEYIDFIESPMLASDKLKTLFEKYDTGVYYIPVMLADMKRQRQDVYWLLVPHEKDCLSQKAEFNKDGSIKKLIINEKKAAGFKIFKIKGVLENYLIIRLDVAESILRRDFTGITLKKLDKDVI